MHVRQTGGLIGLALLAVAASASIAAAQTLCLHEASGPSGIPRWWDEGPNQAEWKTRPRLDPGWAGAAQMSFGSNGRFRAVVGDDPSVNPAGSSLFLTWQLDTSLINSICNVPNARLFLILADAAGSPESARAFRFEFHTSPTGPNPAALVCDSRVASDPAAWCADPNPLCPVGDAGVPRPGGQSYALYDLDPGDPAKRVYASSAAATRGAEYLHQFGRIWVDTSGLWNVNLALPIDATSGIPFPIDDGFRLYFEVRTCSNAGCTIERWPRFQPGDDYIVSGSPGAITAPPIAKFGTVGFEASSCPGIALRAEDIGAVKNPPFAGPPPRDTSNPASYAFDFTTAALDSRLWGAGGGSPVRNVLVARPYNGSSKPINAGELAVTFRIADWGSHADVGSDSGVWRGVPGEPEPPGSGAARPITLYPATILPGKSGLALYQWQLTDAERCQYGLASGPSCGGSYRDDQSLLVELRSTVVGSHDFAIDSAVRSMRFVETASFADQAVIDIRGAPDLADGRRPAVYLFVQTANLPEHADEVPVEAAFGRLADYADRLEQSGAAARGSDEVRRVLAVADAARREVADRGPLGADPARQARLYDLLEALPPDALRFVLPTVEVAAFRESPRRVRDEDGDHAVLEPMTAFGLHARVPAERAVGWTHALAGRLEQTSDGLYRVPFRPGEDQVVLTASLAARAEPPAAPVEASAYSPPKELRGPWIGLGLLAALTVGLVVLALRNRRS